MAASNPPVTKSRQLLLDTGAWVGNVASSVCIIFINKVLMSRSGYGFQYATTLSALHFTVCATSFKMAQWAGYVKSVKLPMQDLVIYTLVADAAIASCNLSLLLNPVAIYQLAKLLVIPFLCLVERFWLGRIFTVPVILSVGLVIVGVATVTVTNFSVGGLTNLGLMLAASSVVTSGMQQILCRYLQQKHGLSSYELLSNTAQAQAITLLPIGPVLDHVITGMWVNTYRWSGIKLAVLSASCFCAIGVNLFQFVCLGRFSAVSSQIIGHVKTFLVLLGGFLLLGDTINGEQCVGIGIAMAGMVLYGYFTNQAAQQSALKAAAAGKTDEVKAPLLQKPGHASPRKGAGSV